MNYEVLKITHEYLSVEADNPIAAVQNAKSGNFQSVREGTAAFSLTNNPPSIPRPEAVPYSEWPKWAKGLAKLAKPEDRGVGDVVARTIGPENSAAFKAYYKSIFGKECGCTGRHIEWNRKYPMPVKKASTPNQPYGSPQA